MSYECWFVAINYSYSNSLKYTCTCTDHQTDPCKCIIVVDGSLNDWKDSTKETTAFIYDTFARWIGVTWEKPRYRAVRKFPFIPHEREIDDLIAGCNKLVAIFLQIIKETGARAGEVFNLKWIDLDFECGTLRITPEKGSNPRIFKISRKLTGMLETFPKEGERIFSHYKNLRSLMSTFERNRKRIAHKVGNPRLLKISFHTIRHWKATLEYARTKDILHVMQMLGHRNIRICSSTPSLCAGLPRRLSRQPSL